MKARLDIHSKIPFFDWWY